ncbi:LuxR C-terminal-related transcriptional regulator [Streptomyces sp. NPDC048550]|uniref:helix-turn-helix transcriptional regulator n=1 Tax=unclassified Streptomyces TaxID=2593676 RepID=UPI000A807E66|nr:MULTISPECIES: LuxR C-terminal-related transcriptional regulator [unclassified Streptomyces]MCX5149817.1 LuxR C-terminal-related transcriptional regulator [Streptomyces sp. NBC_00320]WSN52849.1 LuxR C-terminal-related transcriptional regulator [Streptomyces sp. NBC_01296]WSW57644.1 LuxR C-terminal-related transcriptional regulator [Streptomyces sp. NBC_00998]
MDPAEPRRPQDRDQPSELTSAEMDLYREFAEQGPLHWDQLTARTDSGATARTLDTLLTAGLVQQVGSERFAAANPVDVSGQLLKRWEDRVQGAQLDLLRIRGQLAELALVHAARQRTLQGPPLERIESAAEVHQMLDQQAIVCSREVLSAEPGGPQPAAELGRTRHRNQDLLARGVQLRTLYQHSARFDPATVRYAAELADLGAEARTVTGGLTGCILFDRILLVIPLQDAAGGALLVRSPDLVAFAAEMFDFLWATGESMNKPREKAFVQDIADQTKRSILLHLAQGEDDRTTARALGISVRTCQRHVSDIMRRLGATSRFQLGYLAHRHALIDPDGP